MSHPSRAPIAYLALALSVAFAASPLFVDSFQGFDPNQFPVPQENPPGQPAGYAFSIWGVIYLWLIVGMGYGAMPVARDGQWPDMRLPLSLSLAGGGTVLPGAGARPGGGGRLAGIVPGRWHQTPRGTARFRSENLRGLPRHGGV